MKMPMLFDTKEQAEKKLINLTVKALIKWEINGCHAVCINITIKNYQLYLKSHNHLFDLH